MVNFATEGKNGREKEIIQCGSAIRRTDNR